MTVAPEVNMETNLQKPYSTPLVDLSFTLKNCNTQTFFDRDVEVIICQENRQCEFRRSYNNLVICTCPEITG